MDVPAPDVEQPSGDHIATTDELSAATVKRNKSNPWRRLIHGLPKRTSWNHSLSIRGRESIIFVGNLDCTTKPKQRRGQKKLKQKKAPEQLYDFSKEKAYFEDVDAFELLEESPSPNKFTWKIGADYECVEHDLTAILVRWRRSKLFSGRYPARPLSKIMETIPIPSTQSTSFTSLDHEIASYLPNITETPFHTSESKSNSIAQNFIQEPFHSEVASNSTFHKQDRSSQSVTKVLIGDLSANSVISSLSSFSALSINHDTPTIDVVGIETDLVGLGPSEWESLAHFDKLLMACNQTKSVKLSEALLTYCNASSVKKLGEGTYGEAFKVGETVCKIVPIDGDLVVNGELQKKSEEVLEEVLLSLTLNSLREKHEFIEMLNWCSTFIEIKDFRVCQGLYHTELIRAWEDWDANNTSENDHPSAFLEDQRYIVFVLADGGRDLESFVLRNFDEARSILVQVAAALAVAEAACEFEHRDLHWGNILLCRNGVTTTDFVLEGRKMRAETFGLALSIIDFTLSRINTGEAVLFLNLSADPELFKGPKLNMQFETYRRMKEVTGECWEESFPKTNVLWLIYLVEILDKKKIYDRSIKDERSLRSFKRRLNKYESAKDSLSDPFFSELLQH